MSGRIGMTNGEWRNPNVQAGYALSRRDSSFRLRMYPVIRHFERHSDLPRVACRLDPFDRTGVDVDEMR
jgi:hypothetical protein